MPGPDVAGSATGDWISSWLDRFPSGDKGRVPLRRPALCFELMQSAVFINPVPGARGGGDAFQLFQYYIKRLGAPHRFRVSIQTISMEHTTIYPWFREVHQNISNDVN